MKRHGLHGHGNSQSDTSNQLLGLTTQIVNAASLTNKVVSQHWRSHLGESTSLFTNVKSTIRSIHSAPKDSIVFSRSLHERVQGGTPNSELNIKTWRETTRCPSDQVIEMQHIRELAKANGTFCAIVSFRPQQKSSEIRYILLDESCLPGGEKAFYFYTWCPYCDCYFSQFKAILEHYLGDQGKSIKPAKERGWIRDVEMWDSEGNEFLQLGNPWKAHKEHKVQVSPTSTNSRKMTLKPIPMNIKTASKSRYHKKSGKSTEDVRDKKCDWAEERATQIQPCRGSHVSLDEIRSMAQSRIGLGMVVKLAARRGAENTKLWYFLASVECLPGGSESSAFISCCPHCETHFRDFTSIFRHYAGFEYVAKAKPGKRQGWIKEVEIWDEETYLFKTLANPWKKESNKRKRSLCRSLEAIKDTKVDATLNYDEMLSQDTQTVALMCSGTRVLTNEYRKSTTNQSTGPDLFMTGMSSVNATGDASKSHCHLFLFHFIITLYPITQSMA